MAAAAEGRRPRSVSTAAVVPSQRVSARDVASAAHARASGRIGGGAGGVGGGGAGAFGAAPPPRSALAREGITPSSTKGPSKPERKALPAPAADAPTEEPALEGPPPRTPFTGGDPTLVAAIEGEMMQTAPAVDWDDVGGLDEAKRLLKEAAVLPLLIPDFFTGIREPWKGVLLFGPPGTGKTMLAKRGGGDGQVRLLQRLARRALSKFHGESEKLARTLFAVARHHAPSVLFFDEIDALLSTRGAANEHEASRRLKSELLTLIDGVNTGGGEGGKIVLVLAATNKPWDLDEAMRRRLERRIHIPLPDASARPILRLNLASLKLADDVDVAALAARANGYSGADLHLVCRDASLMTMRKAVEGRTPDEIVALQAAGRRSRARCRATTLRRRCGGRRRRWRRRSWALRELGRGVWVQGGELDVCVVEGAWPCSVRLDSRSSSVPLPVPGPVPSPVPGLAPTLPSFAHIMNRWISPMSMRPSRFAGFFSSPARSPNAALISFTVIPPLNASASRARAPPRTRRGRGRHQLLADVRRARASAAPALRQVGNGAARPPAPAAGRCTASARPESQPHQRRPSPRTSFCASLMPPKNARGGHRRRGWRRRRRGPAPSREVATQSKFMQARPALHRATSYAGASNGVTATNYDTFVPQKASDQSKREADLVPVADVRAGRSGLSLHLAAVGAGARRRRRGARRASRRPPRRRRCRRAPTRPRRPRGARSSRTWDCNCNGYLSLAEIDRGLLADGIAAPKPVVLRAFQAARGAVAARTRAARTTSRWARSSGASSSSCGSTPSSSPPSRASTPTATRRIDLDDWKIRRRRR